MLCQKPPHILAIIIGTIFLQLPLQLDAQELPGKISNLLSKYGIPQSAVSLDIHEAESGQQILSMNSDIPRNPASVIKLVTTLTALEILGPDHQWKTKYWVNGNIKGGTINGDLVLQGGGDPFLTVDRFWHHVLSIRQRGIHTISGSLVIDNSLFDLVGHDRGEFDGQSTRLYNVGPDAALVNFSATRFIIYPIAGRIAVFADPPLADLVVENNIKAQSGKCINKNGGWTYGLSKAGEKVIARFSGNYRSRCGQHSIARSLVSNHEYTYRLFRQLWINTGGTFNGGYRIARTPQNALPVISYPSEPLADVITGINKYSNNVMSRQLMLTLDAQEEGRPATIEGGRVAIQTWLTENINAMPKLFIDNGSGLSRNSKITTGNLSEILHYAWRSNFRPEFLSSLPLAALDGTMRKRLHDSALEGRARIKTGLISGVRSMAGFVNAHNNKRYSVAMMIESSAVNYWNRNVIQDAVLEWVYNL